MGLKMSPGIFWMLFFSWKLLEETKLPVVL